LIPQGSGVLLPTTTSRGLHISTDGNTLTFNGNGILDVGTYQSIAGTKTFMSVVQIEPNSYSFNEGVRISRSTVGNYSGIYLGCNPNLTYGALTNQWSTGYYDGLRISRADPTSTGNSSIQLGYSRTSNTGAIEG
ncbi:MAG: hypothetical protein EZS28_033922, partial [Streblomastix strix]